MCCAARAATSSSATTRDAQRGHLGQIVVERARRVGRGKDRQAALEMILDGPAHRAAAHRHAAQDKPAPLLVGAAHPARQNRCRRRHDHLEAILRRDRRVEEQDVLRAGSDVDSQNPHVLSP